VEQLLAEHWKKLLGAGRVGLDDDFFALGGHSLLAMQLMVGVGTELGIELSPRIAFEAASLGAMAIRVTEHLLASFHDEQRAHVEL
jgi:acyl carrier protein